MDGRTDGRMDGWMDGCCVSQGGRGCGGGRSATGWVVLVAWLLVAWWVCWLGRVVAWLVGRLVGTPLMGAWMDGCCVNGEGAAPPLQCKPSLPRAGFLVPTALGENTELLLGCLVGTPLMDAWMDGWMDPVLPHVSEASGSVSGGSRRSGQSLRSFGRVPKASNKKLLG